MSHFVMVIPSYWARESDVGWKEGDAVYDHPTSLDSEGTLSRTLQSIQILKDKDFRPAVIAIATAEDIEAQVEDKVANITRAATDTIGMEVLLFGPSHLRQIHQLLIRDDKGKYTDLLKLQGYSNVRNMCTFIPHILGANSAILIDDDEVFEDPEFITKAEEFIGKNIEGRNVNAVAGYYLQPDGDYHVKKSPSPWMKCWGQYDSMNEAFKKVIGTEPRLKETPFVFGGNMIIHRNLFSVVPFDPQVSRGEDIDFLINAKMFGFTFLLDNQLSVMHLPPSKMHPTWMQLRQDIYRFTYERAKIESQREVKGMTRVYPEDFDPYPGCFLKADLDEKIEQACKLLSEEYLAKGDRRGSEEALRNITLARTDAIPKYDPFEKLCQTQKRWAELMQYTSKPEIQSVMRKIIERNRDEPDQATSSGKML